MLIKHKYLFFGIVLGAGIFYSASLMIPEPIPDAPVVAVVADPTVQQNNNLIKGYEVPGQITFAGETVPVERTDVFERFDREIQVNAFWHSNSILLIKRAGKWLPILDSILLAHDIPTDFKYLAVAESGLENVVSPARAVGFWQFLKGTAKDFGLIVNNQVDQRYDPIKSTVAAVKYLKQAHKIYGNWTLVAASYNLGMHATSKILKKQVADSYYHMVMSEEPSRYVFRILAIKNMLENQAQFGFEVSEVYAQERVDVIDVNTSIADWNEFAAQHGTNYFYLKRLNPWIRDYQMYVKQGQSFEVKIPARS